MNDRKFLRVAFFLFVATAAWAAPQIFPYSQTAALIWWWFPRTLFATIVIWIVWWFLTRQR